MTTKVLEVQLKLANSQYNGGLNQSAAATENFARRSKSATTDAAKAADNAAKSTQSLATAVANAEGRSRQALQSVSRLSVGMGVGLVGAMGLAVRASANFNAQMSQLKGVTGAQGAQFAELKTAALAAGQATVFSATQAAQGATELAKAGISVQNIVHGGLLGALNLASAGQLELGHAAEIAASAMTVFGLKGSDMAHIADVLAAGANKAQGSVSDMGLALQQSALVAHQFGLNLDDTVGALALFASNGLIGSDAGTSFKTMLQRLIPTSDQARQKMKDLGIEVTDSSGKMKSFEEIAQSLHDGFGKLNDAERINAMNTIAGQDAIRTLTITAKAGAAGVKEWRDKVNDSGAAAKLAATNMDNLKGDLEKLRGSMETALIRTGDQSTGALRALVKEADKAVDTFGQMPSWLQATALGLTGISAATLLAVGAAGTLLPKYVALKVALEEMGPAGARAAGAIGLLSKALGVAAIVLTVAGIAFGEVNGEKQKLKDTTDKYTQALQNESKAVQGSVVSTVVQEAQQGKVLKTVDRLHISYGALTDAVRGNASAQSDIATQIQRAIPSMNQSAAAQRALTGMVQGNSKAYADWQVMNRGFISAHQGTARDVVNLTTFLSEQSRAVTDGQRKFQQLAAADGDASSATQGLTASTQQSTAALLASTQQTEALAAARENFGKALQNFTSPNKVFQDVQQQLQQEAQAREQAAKTTAKEQVSTTKDQVKQERDALKAGHQATLDEMQSRKEHLVSQSKVQTNAINDEVKDLKRQQKAELDAFDTTHKTAKASASAVGDFSSQAVVHIDRYIAGLQSANKAGEKWQQNLVTISGKVDSDVAQALAQLGPEAAPLLQDLVDSGDKKTKEFAEAFRTNMRYASDSLADELASASIRAEQGAQLVGAAITKGLRGHVAEVTQIAQQYGIDLTTAANPILDALGLKRVNLRAEKPDFIGPLPTNAIVKKAEGGYEDHSAQIAQAGAMRLWAEPETGGESYIPHAPGKRQRSIGILAQTADLFGLSLVDPRSGLERYATGAFKPAPNFGSGLINNIGNEDVQLMLAAAQKLIAGPPGMPEGSVGTGTVGQGWQSIVEYLKGTGVPFQVTSTTGGQHAKGSYHYMGKAVDLVGPSMAGIFHALEGIETSLSELFFDPAGYSYDSGKRIKPIGHHSDHVHAATYDSGGPLMPGWTVAYNGTGSPEHVLTERQIDRIVNAISDSGGGGVVVQATLDSTEEVARKVVRKMRRR